MKAKARKPSAIWHMFRWGFLSGTILAALLIMFIAGLIEPTFNICQVILPVATAGVFLGGIPGIILGLIEGLILRNLLKDIPLPFTKAEMNAKRWSVYRHIFFIPLIPVIGLAITVPFIEFNSTLGFVFIFGIPSIIASIASIYAAHRYMLRLRLWGGDFDNAKIKAKHEHMNNSRLALEDGDEDYVIPEIMQSEQEYKLN